MADPIHPLAIGHGSRQRTGRQGHQVLVEIKLVRRRGAVKGERQQSVLPEDRKTNDTVSTGTQKYLVTTYRNDFASSGENRTRLV